METKVKDIINIDFDQDILASFLEKLSLEPTIPDLKDSVNILENDLTQHNQNGNEDDTSYSKIISVKQELFSDYKEEKKLLNSELLNDLYEKNKTYFKKETFSKCEKNIDDSYIDSEESSDDEASSRIKVRGGPHRNKRKISKKKQSLRHTVQSSELNQASLRFLSSGCIIQNNDIRPLNISRFGVSNLPSNSNIDFQNLYSVDSLSNTKCIFSSGNLFYQTQSDLNCCQSTVEQSETATQDTNSSLNSPLGKTSSYFDSEQNVTKLVCSPESGYDTSPASSMCSPSPPISSENFQNYTDEQLQSLINDILDLENVTMLSNNISKSAPNDVEQLKNFLKDSSEVENKTNEESQDISFINSQVINFDEADLFFNNLENNQPFSEGPRHVVDIQLNGDQNSIINLNSTSVPDEILIRPKDRRLSFELNNSAKHKLRFSKEFSDQRYMKEQQNLLKEIKEKEQRGKHVKVIDFDKDSQSINFKRTNLHNAVLNSNMEKVYCLVEAQKTYVGSLFDINIRDEPKKKTALDYAIDLNLPLIIEYLKENTAVKGI